MIAVDSSALIAILLDEPTAEACAEALAGDDDLIISAATLTESFIVARARGIAEQLQQLIAGLGVNVVPVAADAPWRIEEIHQRWGKGNHPARLNIIDCFSYDVARQFDCPLLFVGNDFSQTDIAAAIAL